MLVIIEDEIFNLSFYESLKPLKPDENCGYRIGFFRDDKEVEYISFENNEELITAWNTLKHDIRGYRQC